LLPPVSLSPRYYPKDRITLADILKHPFITQQYPDPAGLTKPCTKLPQIERACGIVSTWHKKTNVELCIGSSWARPTNLDLTAKEAEEEHWVGACRPPKSNTAILAWRGKKGFRCEVVRKVKFDKKTAWVETCGEPTQTPKFSCMKGTLTSNRYVLR
jgi:hypothetical protein